METIGPKTINHTLFSLVDSHCYLSPSGWNDGTTTVDSEVQEIMAGKKKSDIATKLQDG